jgi:hypothetical protein
MADAARAPEDPSYYRRAIDFCREWGMNAYLLSLTDDQGCALRFKGHPELITHEDALTPEQARDLARYAQERGVELIPVIESFGHTRYVTGVPEHAGLADRMPGAEGHFSAVTPVSAQTLELMADLYREVAELFPSRYLHGGCDEVSWGGSEASRRALETRSRDEVWAGYLNSLDDVARGLGKELVVWGDHVLHKRPGVLARLNKDVIIMDWQYYVTDPKPLARAAQTVIDAGLRVIGAPALVSCRWGPRPGANALRNVDAFADAYRSLDSPRALGVIVTNWMPSRYIQDSLWDSYAYAAVALTEGSSAARSSAFPRFVDRFYRARWSDDWSGLFETYYDIAPNRSSCSPAGMGPLLPVPWRSEDELAAAARSGRRDAPPFKELRSRLVFGEALVRDHFDEFAAFRLSVAYLEHVFWRITAVVEEAADPRGGPDSAAALIRTLAERDQRLLEALDASWKRGRASDAAARLGPVFDLDPGDQLLYTFHQAATFSRELAADPARFSRVLASASR